VPGNRSARRHFTTARFAALVDRYGIRGMSPVPLVDRGRMARRFRLTSQSGRGIGTDDAGFRLRDVVRQAPVVASAGRSVAVNCIA
jgi:hypothetical protein